MASSQLIFCNRVFLIMNMYKAFRTIRQIILEVLVYVFVGLMPLSTIPVVWKITPDQEKSKRAIIEVKTVYGTIQNNIPELPSLSKLCL
uniref:Col_cuticle_N domain-containing protein n=1 Tax=Caenorhabditis tropicalis TaxID=1561998 RepID=A0A1I7T7K3_9PELO